MFFQHVMQNGEKLRLRDVIDDDSRKALPDTLFCKHGGVPLLLNRNDLDKKIFLRSQLDNALERRPVYSFWSPWVMKPMTLFFPVRIARASALC